MGIGVYVAGKTDDWERVRRVQEAVVSANGDTFYITYDWTALIEAEGADFGLEEASERLRAELSDDDKTGVRQAELVIVCADYKGLCGTLIELGMAMAYEPAYGIIVVGEPERNSIFFSDPIITRVPHEDDVVPALPA